MASIVTLTRSPTLLLAHRARAAWAALRRLANDDAYARYLVHHAEHHDGTPPLTRKAFYLAELERKWSGVQRCC